MEINVLDRGVLADGKTLNSSAVQNIVDECYAKGGGKIIFPKGKFVLGTVFLKSNIQIYLEEGAELLGAESYYDYAQEEKVDYPIYQVRL